MFCKYKTNIAKRKKTISKHPFFITKPSLYLIYLLYPSLSPLSYLSTLSYLSYLSYLSPLSYLYPSISSIPPPAKSRRRDNLSELKLILYANNMSVRLVIVIVVMYRLIEIVQPHFMFLSNLPVYACRIACLLH